MITVSDYNYVADGVRRCRPSACDDVPCVQSIVKYIHRVTSCSGVTTHFVPICQTVCFLMSLPALHTVPNNYSGYIDIVHEAKSVPS